MASKLVTVFGGSGFLGRRIVEHLAAAGHDVRVGVRHPDRAAFLRRLDRDGRIELVQADVWDEATVTRAVDGAASVINTVGHYVEKGRTTFDRIHGEGALHVARQTKQEGAVRLIHISGLGADPGSDSPYVRARGTGESLVKEAFDGVTILRPGVIFGPDDSFLNRLAMLARQSPVLPLFGTGGTRLQPVFVENVAEACVRVLANPSTRCRVYELGGPRVYAYKELVQLVLEGIGRRTVMIPVPLPRVGHPRGRDGISPRSAADPRSGETDVTGQCRRAAGVDPGRLGHSPYSGGRGLARLHRRDLFLITRAVRARPHPSPRSLPRDRVIQRDTVYSGRILQRPDFWDRVPGSGVAEGDDAGGVVDEGDEVALSPRSAVAELGPVHDIAHPHPVRADATCTPQPCHFRRRCVSGDR